MPMLLDFVQETQAFASVIAFPEDLASFCQRLWSLFNARAACESRDESLVYTAIVFATASKALAVLPRIGSDFLRQTSHVSTRRRVNFALAHLRARARTNQATLAATAGVARLSKWHMSRAFVQETGFGFLTHLHGLRVLQTLPLMPTPLSVKEISTAAGYATTDEYSRHFTALFGARPSAFRESLAVGSASFFARRGSAESLYRAPPVHEVVK